MAEQRRGELVPVSRVNELAATVRTAADGARAELGRTYALALAVQQMREVVAPLVPHIRPIVGTRLGFKTDKQYPDEVLTDCMIEAVVRGVRWVGNEFNVIGGNCYVTKEGYTRLVAELDGLTDLELTPSVPAVREGGAVVKYRAAWKLHGKPMHLERDIPVRLNAGQGADAAIGKATRKVLAAIHGRVTGSAQSLADVDAEDVEGDAGPPRTRGEKLTAALADKAARVAEAPRETVQTHIPGIDDPSLDAIKG